MRMLVFGLALVLMFISAGILLVNGDYEWYQIAGMTLQSAVVIVAWHFFDSKIRRRRKKSEARKLLTNLLKEIQFLRADLEGIDSKPGNDSLDQLVVFFNSVSKFHDRNKTITSVITAMREANDDGQLDDPMNKLTVLQKHIENAGRGDWNRTAKGEQVTPSKVFLGNIYGLFTHPISYWKQYRDEPKDQWNGSVWQDDLRGMNSYDVVSRQARRFISSHTRPMIDLIDGLKSAVN